MRAFERGEAPNKIEKSVKRDEVPLFNYLPLF
jgi:hypothetical protein